MRYFLIPFQATRSSGFGLAIDSSIYSLESETYPNKNIEYEIKKFHGSLYSGWTITILNIIEVSEVDYYDFIIK